MTTENQSARRLLTRFRRTPINGPPTTLPAKSQRLMVSRSVNISSSLRSNVSISTSKVRENAPTDDPHTPQTLRSDLSQRQHWLRGRQLRPVETPGPNLRFPQLLQSTRSHRRTSVHPAYTRLPRRQTGLCRYGLGSHCQTLFCNVPPQIRSPAPLRTWVPVIHLMPELGNRVHPPT